MKKLPFLFYLIVLSFSVSAQSYLAKWNSTTSAMEIKKVDLATNVVTDVGVSTKLYSTNNIDDIYFDQANNQLVALYQYAGLWKYNLTTNTDQIVNLGSIDYSFFFVQDNRAFLMYYTNAANYQIQEIDLNTNVITNIGTTAAIGSRYAVSKINYDKTTNQLVALYENNLKLWKFNLSTKTDNVILIGGATINYSDILLTPLASYAITWGTTTNRFQIQKINLSTGSVTNAGISTKVQGRYDLSPLFYDQENNQLVALNNNTSLWKYDLGTNLDQSVPLDSNPYKSLTVYNPPKESASIQLNDLTATYDATAHAVTATTNPAGLAVAITYNGSPTAPVNAGTYAVYASIKDADYMGVATGSLVISKAAATVAVNNRSAVYGEPDRAVSVAVIPSGLALNIKYDGSSTVPSSPGTYTAVATVTDPNYQGIGTGTLLISKAKATISLSNLTTVYNGSAQEVLVSITPSDLDYTVTYNGSATRPTDAGTYTVVVENSYPYNYEGTATANFVISKADAEISLTNLAAVYDGTAKEPTVTTTPADLQVEVRYNGSGSKPVEINEYSIDATITDPNYQGSASGSFIISSPATAVTANHWAHVQLFPNPAKEIVYINSVADVTSICITDVHGSTLLKKSKCNQFEQFDVNSLSKGIYILTIEALSGKQSYRLVIN